MRCGLHAANILFVAMEHNKQSKKLQIQMSAHALMGNEWVYCWMGLLALMAGVLTLASRIMQQHTFEAVHYCVCWCRCCRGAQRAEQHAPPGLASHSCV